MRYSRYSDGLATDMLCPADPSVEMRVAPREIIAMAAAYRHALLNHLQVVSGWLQLGDRSKAERYVSELTEALHRETMLSRVAHPVVAATLLLKKGLAEGYGIELGYTIGAGVEGYEWPYPVQAVAEWIARASLMMVHRIPSGRRVEFILDGDQVHWHLEVCMRFSEGGSPPSEEEMPNLVAEGGKEAEWQKVVARFENMGGKLVITRTSSEEQPAISARLSWPRGLGTLGALDQGAQGQNGGE